jgi:hypothetical protein
VDGQAAYLTIVAGSAAAVLTTILGFYVPLCGSFFSAYVRWTLRAARAVRPLAVPAPFRPLTRAAGIVAVSGWRVCLGLYLAALMIFILPLLLFVGTFAFALAVIRPG